MGESMTSDAVLAALKMSSTDATIQEFQLSGTVPLSIAGAEIKKTLTVMGITPEDFSTNYTTSEFNFEELKIKFMEYCKDYGDTLSDNTPSKALEFAAKMLFEYGPFIRTERKSKGDKAIRFRFPYKKIEEISGKHTLTLKVVLVTTFIEMTFNKQVEDDKLILTFRQAALLAIVTFSKAIDYCYTKKMSKLLTPLCGAIFSRDSITEMSQELGIEELLCLKMINESSASGGQYLANSDIACAIVCMITATKKVTDKNIRDSMISKVVKQYTHQKKPYSETRFTIFSRFALGGVPIGLDSGTLIEMYNNIQVQHVNLRARSTAIKQTETIYGQSTAAASTETPKTGSLRIDKKK